MTWQQASEGGGPLEPHAWVTVHHQSRYAALDSDIAQGLRERAKHERLRAGLSAAQDEIARLTDELAQTGTGPARDLAEGAIELTAAGLSRLLGRAPRAQPTTRSERHAERDRLRRELTAATDRRDAIRSELQHTAAAYRSLMTAATEKARRVVADEAEGWQKVREVLDDRLPRATSAYEQVEITRDRLRDARLAAGRTHDAVRDWSLRHEHGADADSARTQARRLEEAIEDLRSTLARLGPDAPDLDDLPRPDIPAYGTAPVMHRRAVAALRDVARIERALDALGRLDGIATRRIEAISEAEDKLIDLMRRPY